MLLALFLKGSLHPPKKELFSLIATLVTISIRNMDLIFAGPALAGVCFGLKTASPG